MIAHAHGDCTIHWTHAPQIFEALSDLPFEYQNNAGMTSDKSNLLMMSNPKFVRNTRSNPVFYNTFLRIFFECRKASFQVDFCCFEFI